VLSLYRKRAATCPEEICGCAINPGFKNILRILKMTTSLKYPDEIKYAKALKYFYNGKYPDKAFDRMMRFISAGQEPEQGMDEGGEPQMDFDFDADEIYCSFISEYGINLLRDGDELHWYEFLALLNGLPPECALNRKIQLRFADLKGLRGKELEDAQAAKERVQIPEEATPEEMEAERAFRNKWGRL